MLTGLAAVGVAAVGEVALNPAAGRSTPAGPRSAWPATGAGDAQVDVIFRVRTPQRALALTFDDGPDPRWTPQILDILARRDITATFFVVGERARHHPALLRRIAVAGHAIGNHTDSHTDLAEASSQAVAAELARTNDAIADITGSRPTLMRPPYGHLDPVGLLAAAEAELTVVLWSQLIRGSAPDADAEACLREVRPGSIVLAHDGGPTPNPALIQALTRLIERLRSDGYALVDVPTLLRSRNAR